MDLINDYGLDNTGKESRTNSLHLHEEIFPRYMKDWLSKDDFQRSIFQSPDQEGGPELLFLRQQGSGKATEGNSQHAPRFCVQYG